MRLLNASRSADRFAFAQVLLGLLVLLLLGALSLVRHAEIFRYVVALCQPSAQAVIGQGWTLLFALPILLGTFSLVLLGLSIWRQLRATRRLLRLLGPPRPLPLLGPELARLAEHLGLAGRLRLVADPRPLAFCAGLACPRVWLTTGLLSTLDQEALAAVLRHEGHHVRHRDPLKLLLVRALVDAFFFLPVMGDLGRAYEIHKELAADAEATRTPAGELGLARALMQLLRVGSIELDRAAVGPLMPGKRSETTQARLGRLTKGAVPLLRPSRRSLVLTAVALFLFLVIGLAPVVQPVHAARGASCEPEAGSPVVLRLDAP